MEKRPWVTEEELVDYYAIGQCTPGVIAVNLSTFVGRKRAGDLGGVTATAGFILPSLVIIVLLAGLITHVSDLGWVQNAFAGIRACVCVLIFNAVVKLVKKSIVDRWTLGIFIVVFALGIFVDVSPVWFVLAAAAVGLLVQQFGARKAGGA
ncbi:chromate transporter [Oscillibacter sp.]|uniref:chromate transporter n=1 Tax=Oscillibacter sp. TaxID=1945593 RepID=UPI00345B985D